MQSVKYVTVAIVTINKIVKSWRSNSREGGFFFFIIIQVFRWQVFIKHSCKESPVSALSKTTKRSYEQIKMMTRRSVMTFRETVELTVT